MWRLRKSTVYITNLLFSAILAGYILSYCFLGLFSASHDSGCLFSGFTFFVFFALPVIYLLSLIFAWSFGKIFPFIYAKTSNIPLSSLLTGIVLMGLSAFLYYLLFFDYYQNPTPPLGAPKDYFRHLSAYKSELSTFVHVVFASVVMSYLTYKYGDQE